MPDTIHVQERGVIQPADTAGKSTSPTLNEAVHPDFGHAEFGQLLTTVGRVVFRMIVQPVPPRLDVQGVFLTRQHPAGKAARQRAFWWNRGQGRRHGRVAVGRWQ